MMDMQYNYSGTANNGRITGAHDYISGEDVTYTYDALNRLTGAAATGQVWTEAYSYDGFGNLTAKQGTGGAPSMSATYNANNRDTSASYDGNGNVLTGGNAWNVENQLATQTTSSLVSSYTYDPWGLRVLKDVNTDPQGVNGYAIDSANVEINYYGITGQRLITAGCHFEQQMYLACSVTGQNVYFGGKQLVSNGVTVATDRLGSVRGNGQGEHFTYYPYGEERTSTVDGRDKFGTYFRDRAGQDYAEQRYYGADKGRFWSVDPAGGNAGDPGGLNRYAYVQGDPVNYNDSLGLNAVFCTEYNDAPICGVRDLAYPGGGYAIMMDSYADYVGSVETTMDAILANGYLASGNTSAALDIVASNPNLAYVSGNDGNGDGCTWSDANNTLNCQVAPVTPSPSPSASTGPQPVMASTPDPNDGLPTPSWIKATIPGTNYCGPGGSGTPRARVDAACATHDRCYQNAGAKWYNNVLGTGGARMQSTIQACNTQLCNSLRSILYNWPTSQEIGQATLVGGAFGCMP